MVYILDINGQPLMPTTRHGKVKHLLKSNRAKVIKRCPFTIKLLYKSTTYTQNLTLGMDTGSGTIGTAVSTDTGDILYASKVILRNDIKDKMDMRRMYRRNRRSRKTRYRKVRFLNRKNSTRKDRLSPTMASKLHSHDKEITFIKSILPIKTLVFESGQFDIHLMKNPSLANEKIKPWGYQKGKLYGYDNVKAYVLARDNYTCQCCKNKKKHTRFEVHHIIFKSMGGSDDESNLITLCDTCHKLLHAGKINPNFTGHRSNLKYATQMNVIRSQLFKLYPTAIETFGYVTKANMQDLKLTKNHHIDASVIASNGLMPTFKCNLFIKKEVPKGDFQKTKGIRSEQVLNTGKIQGFKKYDKVLYFGKTYFIKGRMSTGYAVLMDITGTKADFESAPKGFKTPKLANLKRLSARSSQLIYETTAIHPAV